MRTSVPGKSAVLTAKARLRRSVSSANDWRKLGTGPEIGSHLNVDHRNAPERQALASVLLGQIGRFECDAVELLFVAGVYVRRDQIDQLALRLECPEYVRGLVPQPLEQLFGRFAGRIESCAANVVFRVTRIGEQPL